MPVSPRHILVALCALLITACGEAEPRTVAAAPWADTATYPRVVDAPVRTANVLTAEEDLRLGDDAAVQFHRIGHVAVNDAGDVFVYDSGDLQVRVFDSAGRVLREFGRKGKGPGEFEYVWGLSVSGDSVFVLDVRLLHIFDSSGRLLNSVAIRPEKMTAENPRPRSAGGAQTTAGFLLHERRHSSYESPPRPDRVYNDTIFVRPVDVTTGAFGEPVHSETAEDEYLVGELGYIRTPFAAAVPRLVIAPDGRMIATRGDSYDVRIMDADGRPQVRIRADVTPRPATEAEFRQELEEEAARFGGVAALEKSAGASGEAGEFARMLVVDWPKVPRSKSWPVLGRIVVARNGSFMVERLDLDPNPAVSGDPSEWDLFEADGTLLGRAPLPARYRPLALGGAHVYGMQTDSLDVQSLVRFRLSVPPQ